MPLMAAVARRCSRAIAALGIASPLSRHSAEAQRRFVALTMAAAAEVARALGLVAAH